MDLDDDELGAVIASVVHSTAVVATVIAVALPHEQQHFRHVATSLAFEAMLEDSAYDQWFRGNLMCGKATFSQIVALLRECLDEFEVKKYVKEHSFAKKVAMFLYYLCSQGGYRETAHAFGISVPWVQEIIAVFLQRVPALGAQFIKFPTASTEWTSIERKFYEKKGFPGVVGALDGSIIRIPRPAAYEGLYYRRGYTALNVQAVVDADRCFMSIEIRPGSWSDKKFGVSRHWVEISKQYSLRALTSSAMLATRWRPT